MTKGNLNTVDLTVHQDDMINNSQLAKLHWLNLVEMTNLGTSYSNKHEFYMEHSQGVGSESDPE